LGIPFGRGLAKRDPPFCERGAEPRVEWARMPALAADDVKRLVRRASGRGHTGSRNRALVSAFVGAGLGVAEALCLTEADLDPEAGVITVAGPRVRTVSVSASMMESLQEWATLRRGLGIDGGPLFCTRDGLPLEASYVRRLIARLGREAGIEGVVNARALRESYAAARLAAGASVEDLQRELGHASSASTQRFVRQLGVAAQEQEAMAPEVVRAMLAISHAGLTVLRAERDAAGLIRDFTVEYVNPAGAGIMGRPEDALVGTSVRETFPNSPNDGTYARWMELIETQGRQGEPRLYESEGRARLFKVRRLAIGDRIVMSFEDQGAARAAERAVGLLEARQEAVLEASQAGIMVVDPSEAIVIANAALHRILGVPSGRLVGRSPRDPRWRPIRPDGTPITASEQPTAVVRATGQPVRDDRIGIERPDGGVAWVSISAEPVETGGGAPFGVAVALTDLSEVRDAGARARVAEETLVLVREVVACALVRSRADGTLISASGSMADLVAPLSGGSAAPPRTEAIDPSDAPVLETAWVAALESGEVVRLRHSVRGPEGDEVEVARLLGTVRDPLNAEVEEVVSLILPGDHAESGSPGPVATPADPDRAGLAGSPRLGT